MFDWVYPCPCGWLKDAQNACGCALAIVTKYQKQISGPILDQILISILKFQEWNDGFIDWTWKMMFFDQLGIKTT